MMDEKFREEIDRALPALGYTDRSSFIRDVVYKRLREIGIEIPVTLKMPPQRTAKGGRKLVATQKGHTNIAVAGDFSFSSDALARKDAGGPKGKRGRKGKQ